MYCDCLLEKQYQGCGTLSTQTTVLSVLLYLSRGLTTRFDPTDQGLHYVETVSMAG